MLIEFSKGKYCPNLDYLQKDIEIKEEKEKIMDVLHNLDRTKKDGSFYCEHLEFFILWRQWSYCAIWSTYDLFCLSV